MTRCRLALLPSPAQVVYDTDIPGVLVNSTLLATDSDEPRTMLGQALILTHCGKAQFTNLQIQTVGSYKLLFSATFLSTKETTNLTSAFEVPLPCFAPVSYVCFSLVQPQALPRQRVPLTTACGHGRQRVSREYVGS